MARRRDLEIRIDSIFPSAAIPGGQIMVRGSGMAAEPRDQPEVSFGEARGRLIFSGPERILVTIPSEVEDNEFRITAGKATSAPVPFALGRQLADDVHPVANPAIDPDGNVYTTQSGPRGKKTPVSVYKIARDGGTMSAFLSGIVNPTGLLFRPDGTLLVSSRHEGTVYAVDPTGEMEVFAEGMGIATGLAMDREENVYVGDRTGTVFKISRDRKIYVFATLESSVAAYHLAAGTDGNLFVSAPTTSSFDAIRQIDSEGSVTVWRRGFGRPQGIAFDASDRLHLCASYRGQRGIFRLGEDGGAELVVSGQGIVGLAFEPEGGLVVATGNSLYRIPQLS